MTEDLGTFCPLSGDRADRCVPTGSAALPDPAPALAPSPEPDVSSACPPTPTPTPMAAAVARRRGWWVWPALAAVAAVLAATVALMWGPPSGWTADSSAGGGADGARTAPTVVATAFQSADDSVALYEQVSPSVVTLSKSGQSGSGFIFAEGLVLTNWHVVAGIDPAALTVNPAGGEVELFDHTQRQRTGTVVAADPRLDLAVVAVDDFSDLPALPLAEDSPPVGTGVWAFGAPFGIVGTMTAGRVTGVDVNTTFAQTTVQSALLMTDATVNPGNSGGPLVTADGTVAGLITLRPDEAGDRAVQGLAFALPADAVAWAAEALADGKQPPYVAVGFEGRSTTADDRLDRGVEVTRVVDGMPAADAGMVADDVIVAFDGQDIDRFEMLVEQLRYYRPGDRVTVTVDRDGVQQQLSLQLAARPDDF